MTLNNKSYARIICDREASTISQDEFEIKLSKYRPENAARGTVLIMPPTGGMNFIDKSYAWNLCDAGFDVIILERWSGDDEQSVELELHQRLYTRAHKAIRIVLNTVKTPFVGILGTSVGATFVATSLSDGLDVDAAFVIVGGAPIPDVIVNSDQKAMRDLKERRKEKFGFKNDDEYLKALKPAYAFDPLKIDIQKRYKNLGMVIATEDETVPTAFQIELEKAWKPQQVISLSAGHMWGIIKTWLSYKKEIVQFFLKAEKTKLN